MEPFRVHILGCGSAMPTTRHFSSMQVVECRGKLFMVDCGEGAQLQLRRSGLSFSKLGHLFISHLHGDHCFGLLGMLSTFGLLDRTAPFHIYAPGELEPILRQGIDFFFHDLQYEICFHAVDTTKHQVIYEDHSLQIESIPLAHRLPCCGFLFREKPTLPHIRRDMLDLYNIPVSQINNIKAGADYTMADGTVIPHERLTTPADKPRAYAYCSDTKYLPQLHKLLAGVNTLYHEATYGVDREANAQKYYHSTAAQAAMVARDAQVDRLIIGHYSARYEDETILLDEARKIFEKVELADEKLIFDV